MDGVESVRLLREFERSHCGDGAHQYIYGASASPDAVDECLSVGMDDFVRSLWTSKHQKNDGRAKITSPHTTVNNKPIIITP
jgi:hypothetical protein